MTHSEIVKKFLPKSITHTVSNNLILVPTTNDLLVSLCTSLYTEFHLPLKTIKAFDERANGVGYKIMYVFGIPHEEYLIALTLELNKELVFPTLIRSIYEALRYELEIHSMFGLIPQGNPFTTPFIMHENWPVDVHPLRRDFDGTTRPRIHEGSAKFQKIEGEGIYEIPVGPVHAGIIEPGHFRFSVAGEEIINLEPKLGYTHKGTEKLFEKSTIAEMVTLSEHVSGDTSFTQSLAFCQAIEKLGEVKVPKRALYLRVIFSELERLANHLNDVGFILNDTAFSFGGSNGTRLREEIVRLCEHLTGHRFLRNVNTVGGVKKDISALDLEHISHVLNGVKKDFEEVIDIIENNETVLNRLKKTGVMTQQIAKDYGVVGIGARATGIATDSRAEYPYAAYASLPHKTAKQETGDVYARYRIRIMEIENSFTMIHQAIKDLPNGDIASDKPLSLEPNAYAVGIAEGWRGDIVYLVSTDKKGTVSRVAIRDASFLNWPAVPQAVVGNIVPDFPLINKSFNLSYSGFDR